MPDGFHLASNAFESHGERASFVGDDDVVVGVIVATKITSKR